MLTGELGLARAIQQLRGGLGLHEPMLGEIKNACHHDPVERLRGWLEEARQAARARLLDVAAEQPAPTLVLPVARKLKWHAAAIAAIGVVTLGALAAAVGQQRTASATGTMSIGGTTTQRQPRRHRRP